MSHLLYIFALWRITSLITSEDGPFKVFEKMRTFLSKYLGEGLDPECFWCMSIWISVWFCNGSIINWLAYSAGAILLEEFMPTRPTVHIQGKHKD